MKIFNKIRRAKLDRIKNNIRLATGKYYIKKNSEEIRQLQEIHRLNIKAEKKKVIDEYDIKIKERDDEIINLKKNIEWYKSEWNNYKDLKLEVEEIAGIMGFDNLHGAVNKVFALINTAKDKIEMVGIKHNNRKLIGDK